MRCLAPLLTLFLAVPVVAQPLAVENGAAPGRVGETHFFTELFGAGFTLSFNLDREVLPGTVVRCGLGFSPSWGVGGVPVSSVAGVSFVPLDGTFRPEVGVSAMVLADEAIEVVPAGFLGLRIYTGERSLVRLGATLFYIPERAPVGGAVLPWPSLGFGGRL